MGLIKEPLEVDFFVEPRSLTAKEKEQISIYIREYKAKQKNKKSTERRKSTKTKVVG